MKLILTLVLSIFTLQLFAAEMTAGQRASQGFLLQTIVGSNHTVEMIEKNAKKGFMLESVSRIHEDENMNKVDEVEFVFIKTTSAADIQGGQLIQRISCIAPFEYEAKAICSK